MIAILQAINGLPIFSILKLKTINDYLLCPVWFYSLPDLAGSLQRCSPLFVVAFGHHTLGVLWRSLSLTQSEFRSTHSSTLLLINLAASSAVSIEIFNLETKFWIHKWYPLDWTADAYWVCAGREEDASCSMDRFDPSIGLPKSSLIRIIQSVSIWFNNN